MEADAQAGRLTPSALNAHSRGSVRLPEMHTVSLILKLSFVLVVEFYGSERKPLIAYLPLADEGTKVWRGHSDRLEGVELRSALKWPQQRFGVCGDFGN